MRVKIANIFQLKFVVKFGKIQVVSVKTVVVKDIEAVYELAMKNLGKYVVKPLRSNQDHNHEWRDFRMEDPFGFYLRFTELLDWGQK